MKKKKVKKAQKFQCEVCRGSFSKEKVTHNSTTKNGTELFICEKCFNKIGG